MKSALRLGVGLSGNKLFVHALLRCDTTSHYLSAVPNQSLKIMKGYHHCLGKSCSFVWWPSANLDDLKWQKNQ